MEKEVNRAFVMSALSMFVVGCGGGGGGGDDEADPPAPTARVTIQITANAPIPHVRDLTLKMDAAVLRRVDGQSSAVLTDESGNAIPPNVNVCDANGANCRSEPGSKFVPLITSTTPRISVIAMDQSIPVGQYNSVAIWPIDHPAIRDSFAILDDGRECELTVMGSGSGIALALQSTVVANQMWRINLALDFSDFDPADCDDGTMHVQAVLGIDETQS